MNPRVPRSSALASRPPLDRQGGRPARRRLTLDELGNEVTGKTAAVSSPPWTTWSSRCPGSTSRSSQGPTPQRPPGCSRLGEVSHRPDLLEVLQKACRSLETGRDGPAPRADSVPGRLGPPPTPCWPPAPLPWPSGWRRSSGPRGWAHGRRGGRRLRHRPLVRGHDAHTSRSASLAAAASIDDLGRGLLWRAKATA